MLVFSVQPPAADTSLTARIDGLATQPWYWVGNKYISFSATQLVGFSKSLLCAREQMEELKFSISTRFGRQMDF